jgi:hypothetical protein
MMVKYEFHKFWVFMNQEIIYRLSENLQLAEDSELLYNLLVKES